ncbi:MAG TPA: protein TolR [Allosphingosinicella sp.]|nr:protein TolR [Allosphingosinicella sp.]
MGMSTGNGPVSGRRARRAPMAEINVTPLVDVMLVLLIIFMVTAPLMTSGVQVDLPESKAEALAQDRDPVAVSIDPVGTIYVNDEAVAAEELGPRLEAIRAASTEEGGPRVLLRADQTLNYGLVIGVMGELNRAGLRRVALVSITQAATP